MTRSLRQWHRRLVLTLGVFLPVAFAAGIAGRKLAPTATVLPSALAGTPQHYADIEWVRADLFTKTPIQVRLLREQKSTGRFAVEFATAKDFLKPDLIVYWVRGNPNFTNAVPDDATLLGEFNTFAPLPLPPDAATGSGTLLLYSLADREIIESSRSFVLRKD